MTNADNGGKLIAEVKNAVSNYYNWPISQPNIIEVIDLPNTELLEFKGKYELKEQGIVLEVQLEENVLLLRNTPVGNLRLLAMTKTKFIDIESGTIIEFQVDEKVKGFMANNTFKFIKLEE